MKEAGLTHSRSAIYTLRLPLAALTYFFYVSFLSRSLYFLSSFFHHFFFSLLSFREIYLIFNAPGILTARFGVAREVSSIGRNVAGSNVARISRRANYGVVTVKIFIIAENYHSLSNTLLFSVPCTPRHPLRTTPGTVAGIRRPIRRGKRDVPARRIADKYRR